MSFKIMAYVISIGAAVLGVRWMFFGTSVLAQWGIVATDASLFMCRRYAALYFGLGVMFALGRNAGPSDLRSAACLGIGGAVGLLGCLALWELSARRVTAGIVVPAVIELLIAAGFGWAWWSGR